MPEVVEVALTAMFLDNTLHNKSITDIKILGGRYSKKGLPGLSILTKALPLKVQKVNSKGKFMWFELKNDKNKSYYIMSNFGLTGSWGYQKEQYSSVSFDISDGSTLYFTDPRNFGTLIFTSIKKKLIAKLALLAPDLLKTEFTNDEFHDRIKKYLYDKNGNLNNARKDRIIIQVLMDQTDKTGLGSGLGNYLAAEILYHAKISPHKTIYQIYSDRKLSDKLAESIRYINKLSFETAYAGYFTGMPKDMIDFVKELRNSRKDLYHKDVKLKDNKFMFNVYRKTHDPDGNAVKAEKDLVKGRTTYWSPTIQN